MSKRCTLKTSEQVEKGKAAIVPDSPEDASVHSSHEEPGDPGQVAQLIGDHERDDLVRLLDLAWGERVAVLVESVRHETRRVEDAPQQNHTQQEKQRQPVQIRKIIWGLYSPSGKDYQSLRPRWQCVSQCFFFSTFSFIRWKYNKMIHISILFCYNALFSASIDSSNSYFSNFPSLLLHNIPFPLLLLTSARGQGSGPRRSAGTGAARRPGSWTPWRCRSPSSTTRCGGCTGSCPGWVITVLDSVPFNDIKMSVALGRYPRLINIPHFVPLLYIWLPLFVCL